jgi:hypothetical protein
LTRRSNETSFKIAKKKHARQPTGNSERTLKTLKSHTQTAKNMFNAGLKLAQSGASSQMVMRMMGTATNVSLQAGQAKASSKASPKKRGNKK